MKLLEESGYDGPRHFDAHAYRTEDADGVWDFARGCMRNYLILKEKARQFCADREIQALLTEIRSFTEPSLLGPYSRERAQRDQGARLRPSRAGGAAAALREAGSARDRDSDGDASRWLIPTSVLILPGHAAYTSRARNAAISAVGSGPRPSRMKFTGGVHLHELLIHRVPAGIGPHAARRHWIDEPFDDLDPTTGVARRPASRAWKARKAAPSAAEFPTST